MNPGIVGPQWELPGAVGPQWELPGAGEGEDRASAGEFGATRADLKPLEAPQRACRTGLSGCFLDQDRQEALRVEILDAQRRVDRPLAGPAARRRDG